MERFSRTPGTCARASSSGAVTYCSTSCAPSAGDWVNFVAAPAVWFGLMGALVPGSACVQHFTLRFVFWCCGVAPLRYVRFLNHATDRMLLQRIGGRYRFIHDLLREHFAAMPR